MRHMEAHIIKAYKSTAILNIYNGGLEYEHPNVGHVSRADTPTDLYELSVDADFYKELKVRIETFKHFAHV